MFKLLLIDVSNKQCYTDVSNKQFLFQFHMRRLEQLCVQYLEATISHRNVLEALFNASCLKLYYIKEFCLKFIVKETNYNQIIMSKEFETLERPLMVEVIRRQRMPHIRSLLEPQFDNTGKDLLHGILFHCL